MVPIIHCPGSLELKKTEGEPEVFVISSGGNGTPIYRKLQREGRPFAAGILYTNDVDYQAARVLARKLLQKNHLKRSATIHIKMQKI